VIATATYLEVVVYLKAYPWVVRQFWDHIRDGMSAAEAGVAVGVSVHSGRKWFAQAGGVRPKFPGDGPRSVHRAWGRRRDRLTLMARMQSTAYEVTAAAQAYSLTEVDSASAVSAVGTTEV
jgi:hypothetical protein